MIKKNLLSVVLCGLSCAAALLVLLHPHAVAQDAAASHPDLYHEKLRPQFHVTARQWEGYKLNPAQRTDGWLNDINGLIYYGGEYHAFAQQWHRCWLHFISKDLIHWTELPPAFREDKQFGGVQSGTIVLDKANTSGLANQKEHPVMVAFYSSTDEKSQCIAYSNDKGRTWTKYDKNPVLVHPERDPKVFWYKPGGHWVMFLYGNGAYHILTSKNLLEWKDENHPIANSCECPDVFELPVDGNKNNTRWMLVRGNGKWSLGTFNGTEFKEETPQFGTFVGPNFYATQTWNNPEDFDGRRIQLAWMAGGTYPGMPFNQQMTFPCEFTLKTCGGPIRAFRNPIKEIETLHCATHKVNPVTLPPGKMIKLPGNDMLHVKADLELADATEASLNIRGLVISLANNRLAIGKQEVTLPSCEKTADGKPAPAKLTSLELLIDRSSVEVFGNHGAVTMSACMVPSSDEITLTCNQGKTTVRSMVVYDLESIWK